MNNLSLELINPMVYMARTLSSLKQLNPEKDLEQLEKTLIEMIKMPNYTCFGLFLNAKLIGICSGWTTLKIHCGRQLELDNVIVDAKVQSKGFGKYFINEIKNWAKRNAYRSIGLHTYLGNSRSHKFYFNEGFSILGFHFEQRLSEF